MSTLASLCSPTTGSILTVAIEDDRLRLLARSEIGSGVSCLALDATGRRGWVRLKEPASIVVVELDDDGRWLPGARMEVPDHVNHLLESGDGRWLLGASYGGNWAAAWRIGPDGTGPMTGRVEVSHAHSTVWVDGDVYVAALGADLVGCYRLDGEGQLVPLDPPSAAAPRGSGPRHLVAGGKGHNVYCVTEFSGEVLRYRRDGGDGQLELVSQTVAHATDRELGRSRLGADPSAEHLVWGADLHLARTSDGERHHRWLVASERTESTLAVLPLAHDGSVHDPVAIIDTQTQPRGFATLGDLVLVVGEKSTEATLYRLTDAGELTELDRLETGAPADWVTFH